MGTRTVTRRRRWHSALIVLYGAVLAFGLACSPPACADPALEPLEHFPTDTLRIEAGARPLAFKVWIAATDARREQGLMYVQALAPRQGMLFLFGAPQITNFWMKNTLIPLDLLFIAANGRIIRIAPNATPRSLATISSLGPVTGVLELAGGTAARLGLEPGQRVVHRAFGTAPADAR